jgi:O-antigen/teichoic acid export membrane protein
VADRSVTKRTGAIAAGQGAVKASQLVIAITLVRLMSPDQWSQVALLLSIYLAAVTIGTLNLQHSLLFFMPRVDITQQRRLVRQTAGIMAIAAALIAVALVCLTPALSNGRFHLGNTLPLLALAIALEIPCACAQPSLIAIERAGRAAWWDIVNTTIFITAVVVPAATGAGATGVVLGIVVAACCRTMLFVAVVAAHFPHRGASLPEGLLSDQLRYGLPLGLTIATAVLNRSVDKWFVAIFDPANTGVYAVAAQEIPLLAVLPYAGGAAVVTSVVAAFLEHDYDRARHCWLRQTATMSNLVVPLSAGLIVIAAEVIHLVFTPSFAAGVLPFQLFTAITLHRVAEYGLVLRAANRTRDLLISALVLLAANVVFAGFGAAMWGMVGASLGTLLANALAWWFVLGRLADAFGSTRRETFAWQAWCNALAISAIGVVAASVAARNLTSTVTASLVVKLAVFVAVVLLGTAVTSRVGRTRPATPSLDDPRAFDVIKTGATS